MQIKRSLQQGVTLIELMVTVGIIGILAAIAVPSYHDSVLKSRRADAKGVLLGLTNAMERRFVEANSFCDAAVGGTTVTGCGSSAGDTGTPSIYAIPNETATYYNVAINLVSSSSYTLSASPIGKQAGDACGTLFIDNTGAKSVADATLDSATCWNR